MTGERWEWLVARLDDALHVIGLGRFRCAASCRLRLLWYRRALRRSAATLTTFAHLVPGSLLEVNGEVFMAGKSRGFCPHEVPIVRVGRWRV